MVELVEKARWIRIVAIIQFVFICLSLCACIALEVLWAIAVSDYERSYSSSSSRSGNGYGYGYGYGYGGYYMKRSVSVASDTLGGLHFTTFAAAFGLITSIVLFWLNRSGRAHFITNMVYQGLNWVFFLTAFALAASYISVIGSACMAVAGGPANAGYAAVCALPMTVLAVDLIAWLLFSITLVAEIYYAVKGRNKTVVPPRYVDDEYKVGRNGGQQENSEHQTDGGLRY